MHYLEIMEILMDALETIQAGKRVQISKKKVVELRATISQVMMRLKGDMQNYQLAATFEDFFQALELTESIEMSMLPDTVKVAFENAILAIKAEVGNLAYKYFSINEFEPSDEITPIMQEVVRCHYLGG
jgi:hypothetical protein